MGIRNRVTLKYIQSSRTIECVVCCIVLCVGCECKCIQLTTIGKDRLRCDDRREDGETERETKEIPYIGHSSRT